MKLTLRPKQLEAKDGSREGFRKRNSQILYAPCGFGKTELAIDFLKSVADKDKKAIMVLDRRILCDQTSERLKKYGINHGVIMSNSDRWLPNENVQICSAQTLEKMDFYPECDLLIVDECFTADTLISTPFGERKINTLKDGDIIYNACGVTQIDSTFSSTKIDLIELRLSNGRKIKCTKDHPFFTNMGWKPAFSMGIGEVLFCQKAVRSLWERDAPVLVKKQNKEGMPGGRGIIQSKKMLREILLEEIKESNAPKNCKRKNEQNIKEDRTQTENTWREWRSTSKDSGGCFETAWEWLASRIFSKNSKIKFTRISASLQIRSCRSIKYAMHRVGWWKPRIVNQEGAGREEGCALEVVRVESIKNIKSGCGENVYNLRVSGHPSYFANGVLVHNCHTQRKSTVDFIRNTGIRTLGLSGSPFTKGLAKTYHGVVNGATIDYLVKNDSLVDLKVFIAREVDMTGAKKVAGEWSSKVAAERAQTVTGDVVSEWIKKTHEIFGKPEKTIVFSCSVDHGKDLAKQFNERGYNFISLSYRDSDEYKQEVLKDFDLDDTDIDGVIATDILTKGFDNSKVKIGISTRAFSKSFSSHVQQMGRVMRTHPGKEFGVWIDHSGNYLRFADQWYDLYHNGVDKLKDGSEKTKKEMSKEKKEKCKCPNPECGQLWGNSDTCSHCGFVMERTARIIDIPGEVVALNEVSKEKVTKEYTTQQREEWYMQLIKYCRDTGKKDGFAYYTYHDKFGRYPSNSFCKQPFPYVSGEVLSFIRHKNIKNAYRRNK